ncbi:MAG: LPS-assembly protein LptD, partial [Asticcacaulis sp.]
GLLQPKPGFSRRRGFSLEAPYLWVLEPYSYLIIDPQFNSKVNPLLNMDFSRRFYSGDLNVHFGFTNEAFFDNAGRRIGNAETRDYVLADGAFKINRNWRWSFTAQHVKDPNDSLNPATGQPYGDNANFFERYSIEDAFEQRGELSVDARELINQVNLTRQTQNAFFSLSMASFQTLQIAGYEPVTAETTRPFVINNDIFPTVAPLLEAYWSPKSDILGGQFTAGLTGIGLQHKLYPGDGVAPQAEVLACANQAASCKTGFDTARLTALASWTVDKVWGTSGFKGGPFFDLRHDGYHESDLSSAGLKANAERDLATAGVNIAYPLFQRYKGFNVVLSPVAQFAVSPKYQSNPDIPTEDSQTLEFDQSTLLAANRSPGFDVYESGSRLNLGVSTAFVFDKGLKINTLIGRTLRDEVQTQFLRPATDPTNGQTAIDAATGGAESYDPYGLAYKSSDWIADGDFDTGRGLYGYGRVRLDADSLRLKQGEAGLSVYSPRTEATIRYIVNNNNPVVDPVTRKLTSIYGTNYRNLQLYARHFVTQNWGVSARLDRDMLTEKWRRSTVSVIYRDDCLWLELIYERNDTVLNTVNGKPQSGFLFQIKPLILGMNGATQFHDVR